MHVIEGPAHELCDVAQGSEHRLAVREAQLRALEPPGALAEDLVRPVEHDLAHARIAEQLADWRQQRDQHLAVDVAWHHLSSLLSTRAAFSCSLRSISARRCREGACVDCVSNTRSSSL